MPAPVGWFAWVRWIGPTLSLISGNTLGHTGGHALPICQKGFDHFRAAPLGIDTEHRFGTGGTNKQPGIIRHDVLNTIDIADLGDFLTPDPGWNFFNEEVGHFHLGNRVLQTQICSLVEGRANIRQ